MLGQLDRRGQPFRKCFQVLQKICSRRSTLPASYHVPGTFTLTSEIPVAFGGFCDAYKGTLGAGIDICIKKIRICATNNRDEVNQVGHQLDPQLGPLVDGRILQLFCREAVVWKHLNHPHIVPFMGVTLEPLQFVSKWMPGGDLREYVKNNPDKNRVSLVSQALPILGM